MKFSEHCNLCENEITDFEKGLICGLTNLKPEIGTELRIKKRHHNNV